MSEPESVPNPELVRRLARLVRLASEQPAAVAGQRALVQEVIAAAKVGPARLASAPDGALLHDGVAVVDADEDLRLLASRLDAYGVEELTITARAAAADLFDLGRLLGTGPGADAPATFAARATVIDSRTIPRRLRARPQAPTPPGMEVVNAPPPRRPSRMTPVVAPAAAPPAPPITPEPPPAEEAEALREPPPLPAATRPELARVFETLAGPLELPALRGALDALVLFTDLAYRTGRTEDFLAGLSGLIAIEFAQLARDGADARRQAFAHAIRRLAKPVLLREVAILRHRRAADAEAVARLQAILHRYGRDGVEALIDEFAAAPDGAARRTCVDALRDLGATYDALLLLSRDPRELAVQLAATILGELRGPRAEELLLEVLQHPDARTRRVAVAALAGLGTATAVEALGIALKDDAPIVRARAVAALVTRRDPRAAPLLARVLEDESDREVLYAAMEGLGQVGGAEAVQVLIRCAQGEGAHPLRRSAEFRIHACTALVTIRTPQAMACVQQLRDDRDREVREASVRLVAQAARKSSGSIPAVER